VEVGARGENLTRTLAEAGADVFGLWQGAMTKDMVKSMAQSRSFRHGQS
jgi:hypothetical protein